MSQLASSAFGVGVKKTMTGDVADQADYVAQCLASIRSLA
jgi:hypothetical protein